MRLFVRDLVLAEIVGIDVVAFLGITGGPRSNSQLLQLCFASNERLLDLRQQELVLRRLRILESFGHLEQLIVRLLCDVQFRSLLLHAPENCLSLRMISI